MTPDKIKSNLGIGDLFLLFFYDNAFFLLYEDPTVHVARAVYINKITNNKSIYCFILETKLLAGGENFWIKCIFNNHLIGWISNVDIKDYINIKFK